MRRADSPRGNRQRHVPFLLVTAFVIAADQLSKLWIRANLLPGQSLPEEGLLRLTYVNNSGGILGLLGPQALWMLLAALVIIAAFLVYWRYLHSRTLLPRIASALLFGGGIGNFVDRLFSGHVTDFIDLRLVGSLHWPTFNIADSAIVIGVAILGYFLLFRSKQLNLAGK